ncbi:hypothetical protein [Nevskia soli]|jgi:hypothetical protein|uniref:hypothetical protein n=1 Tax=Nevskia soli TaxID=418856 RepID=UPI001C5C9D77|nr:hypothetical protein [Nevskia soli]
MKRTILSAYRSSLASKVPSRNRVHMRPSKPIKSFSEMVGPELRQLRGKVLNLDPAGLGVIASCEVETEVYAFTFDKIKGYSGESVKNLTLRVGSIVNVWLSSSMVVRVQAAAEEKPQQAAIA